MQGAGKIRAQTRYGDRAFHRQPEGDRLIVAFNQAGIKFFGKAAVEKVYQLLIMVLLLH